MQLYDDGKKEAVKITRHNRVPDHLVGKVQLITVNSALLPDPRSIGAGAGKTDHSAVASPSHLWGRAAPRGRTMCAAACALRSRETGTMRATVTPVPCIGPQSVYQWYTPEHRACTNCTPSRLTARVFLAPQPFLFANAARPVRLAV